MIMVHDIRFGCLLVHYTLATFNGVNSCEFMYTVLLHAFLNLKMEMLHSRNAGLIHRPSIFDCLKYANMEGEGLGNFMT